MALRSRGVGYRPQASLGSVRALLMVAPNSPPSSRAVADVNEPTVSPVCAAPRPAWLRSEEHTSELQSHHDLVCRLLLEKKKKHYDRNRSLPRGELQQIN